MRMLPVLAALLAGPFWETKAPQDWSQQEVEQLLSDSPWARTDGARIYLATAAPVREAERLARLRAAPRPEAAPADDDYQDFLREKAGAYIVVGVVLPDNGALADAREARRMEQESVLRAGGRKVKMVGHFPPTPADPVLRLVFPRSAVDPTRRFSLELYLPSVQLPYRIVEFDPREMRLRGKLEM